MKSPCMGWCVGCSSQPLGQRHFVVLHLGDVTKGCAYILCVPLWEPWPPAPFLHWYQRTSMADKPVRLQEILHTEATRCPETWPARSKVVPCDPRHTFSFLCWPVGKSRRNTGLRVRRHSSGSSSASSAPESNLPLLSLFFFHRISDSDKNSN